VKAVVIAHGDVFAEDRSSLDGADLIVAADGGALQLARWGVLPNVVVGDLDSLGRDGADALAAKGVRVFRHPLEKDESDLELAVDYALGAGAQEVTLVGLFGGARLDYTLANAILLADPRYRGTSMRAVAGPARLRAVRAGETALLSGAIGDLVTLLPVLGDAEEVRTEGLRYPLSDETLHAGRARGVSNVIRAVPASVSIGSGTLLVVETRIR
jgi:thiamine pyrophosphokinase